MPKFLDKILKVLGFGKKEQFELKSLEEVKSLSRPKVRKYAREARKLTKEAIAALNKAGLGVFVEQLPYVRGLDKSGDYELEAIQYTKFLNDKRATVQGMEESVQKSIDAINAKGYHFNKEMWVLHNKAWKYIKDRYDELEYDSRDVEEMLLDDIESGASFEKIIKKFAKYYDDIYD